MKTTPTAAAALWSVIAVALWMATAVAGGVALASASVTGRAEQGQGARTVADHVYTEVQAARGETSYEAACATCHGADLSGATGPSLTERRFAQDFAGKDLEALYTKVATTMPRNAPGSLDDAVYLDIVAYVLRENGFPRARAS